MRARAETYRVESGSPFLTKMVDGCGSISLRDTDDYEARKQEIAKVAEGMVREVISHWSGTAFVVKVTDVNGVDMALLAFSVYEETTKSITGGFA